MIVYGSKGKEKKTGEGQFYCPSCRAIRPYIHKKIGRYFTLYFIPLFKMRNIGEYIECQLCHSSYDPKIIELTNELLQGQLRIPQVSPPPTLTSPSPGLIPNSNHATFQTITQEQNLKPQINQANDQIKYFQGICDYCGRESSELWWKCPACGAHKPAKTLQELNTSRRSAGQTQAEDHQHETLSEGVGGGSIGVGVFVIIIISGFLLMIAFILSIH